MERSYKLPGLNGIRAIAALIVMFFHTDQWSYYANIKSYDLWKRENQAYAVIMFFVLSGFLITYLLVNEKKKYVNINFKNFYIRRILRIWPLYYLVLISGLIFILTNNIYLINNLPIILSLYSVLLSNIATYLGYSPMILGVLWSVGVEEQFYAFWPFIIQKSKNLYKGVVLFFILIFTMKFIFYLFKIQYLLDLLSFMPFEYMAIGAFFSLLVIHNHWVLNFLYHPFIQLLCWSFFVITIIYGPNSLIILPKFERILHAFIYGIIIINVSCNSKTIINLENKFLNFVGKISYGIYCYHPIVLLIIGFVIKNYINQNHNFFNYILFLFLEFGITILISYFSYIYYESWFLKKKIKFEVLK